MKVVYKVTIQEKMNAAIAEAAQTNKQIDYFDLSISELCEYRECVHQRGGQLTYRGYKVV